MQYFLGKTEPDHDYSIDQLRADGRTLWDGIHNALALRAMSQVKPGDKMFIYHSGKERAVVGLGTIDSEPFPNPDDPKNTWTAYLKFDRKFAQPLSLAAFKANPHCKDFALVRQGRLSTMPVPDEIADWILSQVD